MPAALRRARAVRAGRRRGARGRPSGRRPGERGAGGDRRRRAVACCIRRATSRPPPPESCRSSVSPSWRGRSARRVGSGSPSGSGASGCGRSSPRCWPPVAPRGRARVSSVDASAGRGPGRPDGRPGRGCARVRAAGARHRQLQLRGGARRAAGLGRAPPARRPGDRGRLRLGRTTASRSPASTRSPCRCRPAPTSASAPGSNLGLTQCRRAGDRVRQPRRRADRRFAAVAGRRARCRGR